MTLEDCPGRRFGTSDKLYWWRSWEPRTRFAPLIDCPLWVDTIREEAVQKILSRYSMFQGKKWDEYNYFKDDPVSFMEILASIYSQYCAELKTPLPEGLYIRGWYNVLRPGEYLPVHHHSIHENTFLSGNLLLTDSKIPTEYTVPLYSTYGGNFKPPSKAGTITIFPSWVEHKVETNESDHVRISLAWDLYTWEGMMYCRDHFPDDEMMLSVPFL